MNNSPQGASNLLADIAMYFVQLIVGAIRKVTNISSVLVINILLGWTFIGWIVALAMAGRSVLSPPPSFAPRRFWVLT